MTTDVQSEWTRPPEWLPEPGRSATDHRIGTREEWAAAREELLAREKEHTRLGDELARQRRALPWVRVEKDYRLDTDDGPRALAELFDGRSQLLIYHFMFGPSYEAGCPINSSIADSVNGVLPHLTSHDVTMLFVSQAPLGKLQAYKRRMGWDFPWASSANSEFNLDLGYSSSEESTRAWVTESLGIPAADRRAQCQRERHRRRRVPDREPRLQRLRPRGRGGLPDLPDRLAWPRVPDGLLPDPRPGAAWPRRGRWVPAVDPPPRRVRQPLNGPDRLPARVYDAFSWWRRPARGRLAQPNGSSVPSARSLNGSSHGRYDATRGRAATRRLRPAGHRSVPRGTL